jgi:hypothetical protein
MKNQHAFVKREHPRVECWDYTEKFGWYVLFTSYYYPNDDLPTVIHTSAPLDQIYEGKRYWLAGPLIWRSPRNGEETLHTAEILHHFHGGSNEVQAAAEMLRAEILR